jgi:hypothetical protein
MARKNQWADGTLQITGDGVLLTFEGMQASAVKRVASPRMIPFAAIAGVEFVRPTPPGPGRKRRGNAPGYHGGGVAHARDAWRSAGGPPPARVGS